MTGAYGAEIGPANAGLGQAQALRRESETVLCTGSCGCFQPMGGSSGAAVPFAREASFGLSGAARQSCFLRLTTIIYY